MGSGNGKKAYLIKEKVLVQLEFFDQWFEKSPSYSVPFFLLVVC